MGTDSDPVWSPFYEESMELLGEQEQTKMGDLMGKDFRQTPKDTEDPPA